MKTEISIDHHECSQSITIDLMQESYDLFTDLPAIDKSIN